MASYVLCGECGARVPISSKFCPECGSSVIQQSSQPAKPQQPVAPPPPVAAAPRVQASAPIVQPTQPVQYQQPMQYQPQPMRRHPLPPPMKKGNGCLTALLIVLLILAVLGIGGWAVYKYYIKPGLEKVEKKISSFDTSEGDSDSFSTSGESKETDQESTTASNDDADNDDGDDKEITQQAQSSKRQDDIPQGLNNDTKRDTKPKKAKTRKKKNNYSEPFGMTDEEAAEWRRSNGGEPFGMTDEEAAEWRRSQRRR